MSDSPPPLVVGARLRCIKEDADFPIVVAVGDVVIVDEVTAVVGMFFGHKVNGADVELLLDASCYEAVG